MKKDINLSTDSLNTLLETQVTLYLPSSSKGHGHQKMHIRTHTNKYFLVEHVPGASLDVERSDRFASSQIKHNLDTDEGRYAALLKTDGRK